MPLMKELSIDDLSTAYPNGGIPAAVLTAARERADVVRQIKAGGYRGDVQQAKLDAVDVPMHARMMAAWDDTIATEVAGFDQKIGEIKAAAKGRPARDVTPAEAARDARLLARAQLVVARVGTTTDADELLAHFTDSQLTDHQDSIEFIARAVSSRLQALEADDKRRHSGDLKYRSAYAEARGRVVDWLETWLKANPSAAERIRRLENERTARKMTLEHTRGIVMGRIFSDSTFGKR